MTAAAVSGILGTEQNYKCAIETPKESSSQENVLVQNHRTQPLSVQTVEADHVNALLVLLDSSRKEHWIEAVEIKDICSDQQELPDDVAHLDGGTDLHLTDQTLSTNHNDRKDMDILNTTDTNRCIVMSGEIGNLQGVLAAVNTDFWVDSTRPDCSGGLSSVSLHDGRITHQCGGAGAQNFQRGTSFLRNREPWLPNEGVPTGRQRILEARFGSFIELH
ncbi:hypothetical protein MTO96_038093 [Rhipicephalus appendiculatus]